MTGIPSVLGSPSLNPNFTAGKQINNMFVSASAADRACSLNALICLITEHLWMIDRIGQAQPLKKTEMPTY